MKHLLKYLKAYTVSAIVIIVVLAAQAYCDLSLPGYTSDIVNVGIQQGGIDTTIPKQISKTDMEKVSLFLTEEEKNTVMKSYAEDNTTYETDAYILKDTVLNDKKAMEKLSEQMNDAMLLVESMLLKEETKGMLDQLLIMPEEQRQAAVEQIRVQAEEKMKDMPETMTEQAATIYVKTVYENLGVDTEKLQNSYILRTGGKMLALAFLGMASSIIVGFLASKVAAAVGRDLRNQVFQKVVGFSNAEFDKFSTASLITRSTNDIQQIQMLTVMLFRMVLYAPIIGIGGVYKVFQTNVDMSWILAVAVILILIVVILLFTIVMPKFKVLQSLVDRLNLVTREILTGLPVIRAFSTEKYEEKRFDTSNRDLMKAQLFVNRAMTFMMPVMMLIMNGISVLIVWTGAHGIDSGAMQVGDMMAFIQYTMQIIMAFLMICMVSVMLPRAAVSATRVNEVLTSETLVHDPEQPEKFDDNGKGTVVFDHVSFRYPGAGEDVLHDITFTAKPGETTAFIGSTGSGKSTLIHLIPRFYDVTEGQITIDGKNIKNISQHDLRERIGYVPQKGVLFSGTIKSNILYGRPKGSAEEMQTAAEIAQAAEFIDQKKEGYDSHIAQGGANVSGGQKQRLSIARAIAKQPDIFIFDDSFSALDYKTDVTLRKELKKHTKDSTVLIVAQRISTILHAEQIVVLDEGNVAGIGTHKELLKHCEVYRQIAASQLSEKELERDLNSGKEEA